VTRQTLSPAHVVLLLVAIVAGSSALNVFRVYSVPILQCPDEDSHLDYVFSIFSNRGLLRAADAPRSGWNVPSVAVDYGWERISHILTLHLTQAVDMHNVRVSEANKVSADYGTSEFYAHIDASAPRAPVANPAVGPNDNPWLIKYYPFGYYALIASVIKLVSFLTDSVTSWFFAARLVSTALLAASLPVFFVLLRELRVSARRSLMVTAGFAFFPLVQYTTSCIQPDNLGLLAVLLTTFFGLKAANHRSPLGWLAGLSLALGVLAVTKYQFLLFGALPVLLMLWTRKRLGAVATVILMVPSAAALGTHVWVNSGAPKLIGTHVGRSANIFVSALQGMSDYWLGGNAFRSFWSTSYGYNSVPVPIRALLIAVTAVGVLGMVAYAVRAIVRAHKAVNGAQVLTANPMMLGLVLSTGFMVALYAYTDNGFYAQGRHWLPWVPAMIAFGVLMFPTLAPRRWRRSLSTAAGVGLLAFCFLGNLHSLVTMFVRYYPPV
jgi:hypothetical protein